MIRDQIFEFRPDQEGVRVSVSEDGDRDSIFVRWENLDLAVESLARYLAHLRQVQRLQTELVGSQGGVR